MKWLHRFYSKGPWLGIILVLLVLTFISETVAQNKIVVIPLFDSESSTPTPTTQYFVVGSEAFVPGSNVDYFNTGGPGGAYISASGSHALVAPVHLPHGAEVTEFEVFFYDTSVNGMVVSLKRQYLSGSLSSDMAQVNTLGGRSDDYYSRIDDTIHQPNIDNTQSSIHVRAYSTNWDGTNLKIKGAVITYTTP
jgi:hypothetical protein